MYVVGLMTLLLFGAGLGMVTFLAHIPTMYVPFSESPLRWAGSLLMPWIVLGLPLFGVALRMMRATMTEVLDEDYLRTALAKGLRPRTVVRRHAVPSAVAPVFSLMIVTMPVVVTNLVLIEQVYSIPGRVHRDAEGHRDGRLRPAVRAHRGGRRLRGHRRARRRARTRLARPATALAGGHVSARAWAGFAAMSVVWGIPYLFIKVAVDDGVPPAFIAWVRVDARRGGAARARLARRRARRRCAARGAGCAAYAVVEIAIPFPLIAAGEQHVASSLAAILIAAVPLFIALLALRFDPAERATGGASSACWSGSRGVVALMGIDVAGSSDELLGAGAILIAAVGYAIGPMMLKRRRSPTLDPRATMGASLAIAARAAHAVRGRRAAAREPSRRALIVALLVLGLVCTALAFVIFGRLIAEIGPGRALVITYVNPVVAVALGVAVLDERPGAGRDRRPAADPRRLVALDRRAAAALPQSSAATRRSNPAGA